MAKSKIYTMAKSKIYTIDSSALAPISEEQKKIKVAELREKIKAVKNKISTERQELKKTHEQLNELIFLEEAAKEDEIERIEAANFDVTAALGKDKYGKIIRPGSFWSDVYITRREREILEPGLKNKINRLEKHLLKYKNDLEELELELGMLQPSWFAQSYTWLRRNLDYRRTSLSTEKSDVPEIGDFNPEEELEEKPSLSLEESPYINITLTDAFEKSMMMDELEQINDNQAECTKRIADLKQKKEMLSNELGSINGNINKKNNVIKTFEITRNTRLYRFIESIYQFLGRTTKREQQYQQSVNDLEKLQFQLSTKKADMQYFESQLTKLNKENRELKNKQSSVQRAIGHSTREEINHCIMQLVFQDKIPEINKLIKRCKKIHSHYVGHHIIDVERSVAHVSRLLKNFLKNPSQLNLNLLNQGIQDNPSYSKSIQMFSLLKDASILYPEIKITTEPLLEMQAIALDEETRQEIKSNEDKITSLQLQYDAIQERLNEAGDASLLSQAVDNKEALENCYIVIAVLQLRREIFLKNNPKEQLEKKLLQESSKKGQEKIYDAMDKNALILERYEDVIQRMQHKIIHIKLNLSKKNANQIEKEMKNQAIIYKKMNAIDPFVKNKTEIQRLELCRIISQTATSTLHIEEYPERDVPEIDISYHVNSALQAVTIPSTATRDLEESTALEDQLIALKDKNKELKEGAHCNEKIQQVMRANSIISQCKAQTWLNNSITKALGRFLMIPTKSNLDLLIRKIQADDSYINNNKLRPLLREAAELYPDLKEKIPHITINPTKNAHSTTEKLKNGIKSLLPTAKNKVHPETLEAPSPKPKG